MPLQHSLDFEQFSILCKESESFRKSIYKSLTGSDDLDYFRTYIKANFTKSNLIPAVKWIRAESQKNSIPFIRAEYEVYGGILSLAAAKRFVEESLQ